MQSRPRTGYTVIELLVVIGIIGVLIALLLPAVQYARAAARRTQCANNMHNLAFAMMAATEQAGRFPACGNFGHDPVTNVGHMNHSWVVTLLPWMEQGPLADKWDKDKPLGDPVNQPLAQTHIPLLACPEDISVMWVGDLSYVVNGGVGFTVQHSNGVHDCPVDAGWTSLDLNGNQISCDPSPSADGTPTDRQLFYRLSLFFNETWKQNITQRHHRPATVLDGLSQTIILTENARTGYDPASPDSTWACPKPLLTSFYFGNPCKNGECSPGNVDYSRANAGSSAINSGLESAEGTSPVPNSFHEGGVFMAFGDGHVQFVSQNLDGHVYAAMASPQGIRLNGTPLAQGVAADAEL